MIIYNFIDLRVIRKVMSVLKYSLGIKRPIPKIRFFYKILFIYLFLDIGEGREKEREKHQCVVASYTP